MPPRHLVVQHLENVQASFLEEYQPLIREFIHGKHGVYALYSGEDLYYVGLASNMRNRLKNHLKDRHKGLWDRFSVYITRNDAHMRELESLVLRIVKPTGNRQIGKLAGSENVKPAIAREFRQHQRVMMNEMLGKRPRKNRLTQSLVKAKEPTAPLKQYIDRSFAIRATHKGQIYRARVRRNGWIMYNGYLYASPTAAGRDVVGRNVNGWRLWRYQETPGNWVHLGNLRQ